jgi:hypothetical protein
MGGVDDTMYFVKSGSDGLQTRSRNPRFLMPLLGQKTGFRARMTEIKSGIPCSVTNR